MSHERLQKLFAVVVFAAACFSVIAHAIILPVKVCVLPVEVWVRRLCDCLFTAICDIHVECAALHRKWRQQ